MNGNERSTAPTAPGSGQDVAPDLSTDGWPGKFAQATVRRGRPPSTNPKVSTTIRLSRDVIEHFRAGGADGRRASMRPCANGSRNTTSPERSAERRGRPGQLRTRACASGVQWPPVAMRKRSWKHPTVLVGSVRLQDRGAAHLTSDPRGHSGAATRAQGCCDLPAEYPVRAVSACGCRCLRTGEPTCSPGRTSRDRILRAGRRSTRCGPRERNHDAAFQRGPHPAGTDRVVRMVRMTRMTRSPSTRGTTRSMWGPTPVRPDIRATLPLSTVANLPRAEREESRTGSAVVRPARRLSE